MLLPFGGRACVCGWWSVCSNHHLKVPGGAKGAMSESRRRGTRRCCVRVVQLFGSVYMDAAAAADVLLLLLLMFLLLVSNERAWKKEPFFGAGLVRRDQSDDDGRAANGKYDLNLCITNGGDGNLVEIGGGWGGGGGFG